MARIVLDQVDKVFSGGVKAVNGLSLEVPDGEFMVLVGPSGCGESTALRIIAGLEDITHGTVQIGDRVVNNLAAKDRDIAMIFQAFLMDRCRTSTPSSVSACGPPWRNSTSGSM